MVSLRDLFSNQSEEREKNEALRKRYFEEKRVEFEASCSQGDAGACFSLGEWWLLFGKDFEKAEKLFRTACEEKNHGNACFALAQMYQGGRLGETESERKIKSYQLYSKACAAGNMEACGVEANCKLQSFGCEKDVEGAKVLLETACGENDSNSCFRLGRLFLDGETKHGVKKDAKRAFPLMLKSCELGHPNGCQVVSVMYRNGDGVEADQAKHEYYRERTVELVQQLGSQMGAKVISTEKQTK